MSGLKENWKQKLWYERIIFIAGLLSCVAVVVLSVLQICDVWNDAAYAYMPLMSITMLSQAYEHRKKNKHMIKEQSICRENRQMDCFFALD